MVDLQVQIYILFLLGLQILLQIVDPFFQFIIHVSHLLACLLFENIRLHLDYTLFVQRLCF